MDSETPNSILDELASAFYLTDFAQNISDTFTYLMNTRRDLALAVTAIHRAFHALLCLPIPEDEEHLPDIIVGAMTFQAHSSWVDALILSAAGHPDTARAILRRSIEFCCYAVKVNNSQERAQDWLNFGDDRAARNRFCGQTRIPMSYKGEKYRELWPLIVEYDRASNFGTHANVGTLVGKMDLSDTGRQRYHYRVVGDAVTEQVGRTILTGRHVLNTLGRIHPPEGYRPKELDTLLTSADEHAVKLFPDYNEAEAVRQFRQLVEDSETRGPSAL